MILSDLLLNQRHRVFLRPARRICLDSPAIVLGALCSTTLIRWQLEFLAADCYEPEGRH